MFARLRTPRPDISDIHLQQGRPALLARLLGAREVRSEDYLRLQEESELSDAEELPGLRDVADGVLQFLRHGGRLAVHGDYDVDGVSATAITVLALRKLGHEPLVFLPHRMRDGYGLNPATVERLASDGVGGILTVDCGVSGHAAVLAAKERGLLVWLTDHHLMPSELPEAPLAHPGLLTEGHPLSHLSGAGVAYVLARCWLGDAAAEELADLAALGTLADQVALLGENRRIVRQGLRILRDRPRPGVFALLDEARHTGDVDEEAVAFRIAPRLNACGRMDTADIAYRLLIAGPDEAADLARRAGELNRRRQEAEAAVIDAARATARIDGAVVSAGEGWHRGVIGIVASRMVEEFRLPAFIVSMDGDAAHGSARAPAGLPLMEALQAAEDLLTAYGGHRGAAGFGLRSQDVPAFAERIEAYYRDCLLEPSPPLADVRLTLREVTLPNVAALTGLRPFGQGNPEPIFLVEHAEVTDTRAIGDGRHARISLRDGSGSAQAVHWRAAPTDAAYVDLLVALEENAFRGDRSARLRVVGLEQSVQLRLLSAALVPPGLAVGDAPSALLDRRGRGVPEEEGLTHYFTLDATTAREAAAALGAGYYLSAPGQEETLRSLLDAGRLQGVVGPHPSGLPVRRLVALEHPADPGELLAAACGSPLVLAWRREDDARLGRRTAAWEQSDEELRQAYRIMRASAGARFALPPADPMLCAAWAIFRDVGLIEEDRLTDRRVDINASELRVALRVRAERQRASSDLWHGRWSDLEGALRAGRLATG